MAVQENDETFPANSEVWSAVGVSGKALQCPTAGKSIANAYGYSNALSGQGYADLGNVVSVPMTMDASDKIEANILYTIEDTAFRHDSNIIVSYADGHVATTKSVPALYAPGSPIMSAADNVTTPTTSTADTTITSGNWSITTADNTTGHLNNMSFTGDTLLINSAMFGRSITGTYNMGTTEVNRGWEVSFDAILSEKTYFNHHPENGEVCNTNTCTTVQVLDDSGLEIITFQLYLMSWGDYKIVLNNTDVLKSTEKTSPEWKDLLFYGTTEKSFSLVATENGYYFSDGTLSGEAAAPANAAADWQKPTYVRFQALSWDDGHGTLNATYKNIKFAFVNK